MAIRVTVGKKELAVLNTEPINEPKKNVAYNKQSIQTESPNLQITAALKLYHLKSWIQIQTWITVIIIKFK